MSAPPPLRIATTDPTPPYEQLRRQLAGLITAGALGVGERLPPVRQLAADLGVAPGTVARTYKELEAAGLVATRRGGGTRVRAAPRPPSAAARRDALRVRAEGFVHEARLLGAGDGEVAAAVAAALAAQPSSRPQSAGSQERAEG